MLIRNRWQTILRSKGLMALSLSALLFVVMGAGMLIPSHAQTNPWTAPVNVSDSPNGSWFPDLAVDGMGNVHIVWCNSVWDEYGRTTEQLVYSQKNEHRWTRPNDLVADSATIKRNATAVDDQGNLYLAFLEDDPPRYRRGIFFGRAPVGEAYSAGSWSDWRFIGGRRAGYRPDLLVDREGGLHLIYTESTELEPSELCPWGNCSDVFYRNSHDLGKTWSAPANLSLSDPGTKRISLMVDGEGRIHASWDEGGDRYQPDIPVGVAHTMSNDGGATWSEPSLITASSIVTYTPLVTTTVPQQVVVGYDGSGQTVMAWRAVTMDPNERRISTDLVYYQVSPDGLSWSTPRPIPGIYAREEIAEYDEFDMATDSAGILHFMGAVRLFPGDLAPSIYHLQWDGQGWSWPVRVSTGTGYPERPRLAIERGNILHAVWADRESPSYNPQRIDVWHSTKQTSGPAWTPVPTRERPDSPMPTISPEPFADPTPVPTTQITSTGLPPGLDTDHDQVLQLLLALSPVALLIAVIVAIRRRRFKG